jgi:hypothetical protein
MTNRFLKKEALNKLSQKTINLLACEFVQKLFWEMDEHFPCDTLDMASNVLVAKEDYTNNQITKTELKNAVQVVEDAEMPEPYRGYESLEEVRDSMLLELEETVLYLSTLIGQQTIKGSINEIIQESIEGRTFLTFLLELEDMTEKEFEGICSDERIENIKKKLIEEETLWLTTYIPQLQSVA